jgi:predicted RNA binding protein YcfA (HicA-like mRNA interferase family)
MKLPVVSGSDAVKAFREIGYEFDEQHGSHRFSGTPTHRTDVSLFPTIRNSPKEPSER